MPHLSETAAAALPGDEAGRAGAGLDGLSGSYLGRFAPSPTGPLHAGSLVAALGSWLDARAHGGQWLVRIEDIDGPRCLPGMDATILAQLAACGLHSDTAPLYQSSRSAAYRSALDALIATDHAYPCACSRSDVEQALKALGRPTARHAEQVYPGTCRHGLQGRPARAWRLRAEGLVRWSDRRLGPQSQDLAHRVGDFVLLRADGLWAYQLAVVVDDAAQAVSHVVRGQDLADNTARQIALQRALALATPKYLHLPLVLAADGHKLSKQNGAMTLDLAQPLVALHQAAQVLGLQAQASTVSEALAAWVSEWRQLQSRPVTTDTNTPTHSPAGPAPAPRPPIRSFVRRAGRTTSGQTRALASAGPQFILPYAPNAIDLVALYARSAPTILEIGFGMGEATAHIAALMPETNFLCCEVHQPGVGALLKRIEERGLRNIRIISHDAVEVLEHMLLPGQLQGVHLFFPDPWHKKRHHKRRLVQPPLIAQLASRIAPGGYLHCATDWQPYAEQILQVLSGEPSLRNSAADYAAKPAYRPLTKFENRGIKLGHGVWDLVFQRRD